MYFVAGIEYHTGCVGDGGWGDVTINSWVDRLEKYLISNQQSIAMVLSFAFPPSALEVQAASGERGERVRRW